LNFFSFVVCLSCLNLVCAQVDTPDKLFLFGLHKESRTGITVDTPILYSDVTGYGFDFGTENKVQLKEKGFTGDGPVYFSAKLPEGNYRVEVVYANEPNDGDIFIKAESRRVMIAPNFSKEVFNEKKTFLVNLRTPKFNKTETITLKEREFYQLNWDDKLTLEFFGKTSIRSIQITAANDVPTLFLAGDSTVTDQDLEPWASWGQFITAYFKDEIVVANYAYSGASLSSFKGSRRLEKIAALIKEGDFLLIEFGHNDQKQRGEGQGPWLNYTDLLNEFINLARSKGAIPILATPTERRYINKKGHFKPTHGEYPKAMRAVAKKLSVPLIDLTKMTQKLYKAMGTETSKNLFVHYPANTFKGQTKELADNTHFNGFGANEIALCVLSEIKKQQLPLEKYIKEDVPKYNPKRPSLYSSWKVPMSNRFEAVKPDGN